MIIAYMYGGFQAMFICGVLGVMEVSLSFDNAVLNASVLKNMTAFWQKMFLTVGIFTAVVLVRLVLPVVLVSIASSTSMIDVAKIAISDPVKYAHLLHECEINIIAFGGMFLWLLFLNFIFDHERDTHWIGPIERALAKIGKLDTIAVVSALITLVVFTQFIPQDKVVNAYISGIVGICLYQLLDSAKQLTSGVGNVVKGGFVGFIYLEILDTAFSLDGVLGAFTISKSIVVIMLGLGIGAIFVRSLTLYLVEKGTLDQYEFLEHGAHWAIGSLAMIMLISVNFHIPEWITGIVGVIIIGLSVLSSIKKNKEKLS